MVWKQVWILKAIISSFIFCCCFSAPHPLPVFVSLSFFFCFYLFLSTSYSLSPTWFFLTALHLPSPCHIFKTFDMKPPVVLRSKCNAQSGSWRSIAHADPLAEKENQGVLWPLVSWPCHSVPQVWLHDWWKKTPINLYAADSPWCRGSQPCVQRITWGLLNEYWCLGPTTSEINWFRTLWSINLPQMMLI